MSIINSYFMSIINSELDNYIKPYDKIIKDQY